MMDFATQQFFLFLFGIMFIFSVSFLGGYYCRVSEEMHRSHKDD